MNIGILLWNKCNAECEHCAPSSGPAERVLLSDDEIFSIIDASFHDCSRPKIGLSGGEAFLYFERLCRIVSYATNKGAVVSVNTNGSWAVSPEKAEQRLKRVKDCGLSRIVVSTDDFHEKFIPAARIVNTIQACKKVHLEVELQFVASKKTQRLADFLQRFGDEMINVRSREIPCHPVGRAALNVDDKDLFTRPGIPDGLCPSAVLSVAADGHFMPCCNTAGHLESLQMGTVKEAIVDVCQRFKSNPLVHFLTSEGPGALVGAAVKHGYAVRDGYVDQCHLCYDLFKSPEIAAELKKVAAEAATAKLFRQVQEKLVEKSKPTAPFASFSSVHSAAS